MKAEEVNIEYLKNIGMGQNDYQQIYLNCEICERNEFVPVLRKGKIGKPGQYGLISIVQCDYCGHVMVNPRFEKQFYVDYYKKFYKEHVVNMGGATPPEELVSMQKERGARCEAYLSSRFNISQGSILDLGC